MGGKSYNDEIIDTSLIQNDIHTFLERFAAFIHIPSIVLQPYKNEFMVRQYNKGQVIYYSSDELTHMYFLIDGYIVREHYNIHGDLYRVINKDQQLYPLHNLFQDKVTHEICSALTDCIVMTIPIDLIEYLCKNHHKVFIQLFKYLCESEQQLTEYNMALTAKNAKSRVIKVLIYLCHTIGDDHDEFYEIKPFLTIQMVSDLASVSRETTGHIINELKAENLLVKNKKSWLFSKVLVEQHEDD
ncbi:Crp/Fnr family transcriptional regulator [Staphylococcus delphini]|uniref:Crp/Fnr family transcriptional regulator n=1 Tax=Staphylococcus delphini TaxID=53344 RepID=UPI0023B2FB9F|nr:Crp/Fnr family transcriptional regulator [Staphylococcus delphini]MDE9751676.1 Crp/Fnr family transcriptional regulator [Staphylococcus delphini]MDE9788954.1 Crp/Fnr family transcriptional regulator [Staphylococcus delphini]MDE9791413.1 Crp/Fnr family transcriptional regulator [Staphylococcus delphini]MDE9793743.1 Crp/Fnr family transcriptional regulator [Staphylococcus delphini]MDE9795907.1 Crp/Fnr family transcriptional regulator [Staphylococcus delphini]